MSKPKGRKVITKQGIVRETKEQTKARKRDVITIPVVVDEPKKATKRVIGQSPATGQFSPQILAAFAKWRDHKAPIHVLVTETGIKRGKLRRALIAVAGGKDAFKALRSNGAGGTVEPFGGKRATGRTKETIKLDDSKALHLTRIDAKEQGWKTNGWLRTALGSLPLLEGPDGTQYVQAKPTERADLIYSISVPGIPSEIRMKTLKDSAIAKAATKAKKEVERGEKAIKRTRATKKARKVRRG